MSVPELEALDGYRLSRNLSYRALGAEVGLTGQGLYRLLTHTRPNPLDRTMFRIRAFLKREGVASVEATSALGVMR